MTDLKKEGAASQPVISIDSLAPAAIERKAESIGVTKNALTLSRLIPLALAAGFFIGLGGLYFTLFMADSSLSFAVQRFAGALMFSLGLALVIICGAELFTGNSLMIGALASRKIPVGGMLRNWIWVWIFNLVGAVILVTLVYLSDTPKLGQMGATMMKIAAGKVSLGWGTLFFKGILCNVLVCLAVWMGFAAHSVADKILAVLLPVSAFVALGFEHCVANMYFLPMGYLLASSGFPAPAGFDPSVITIPGIFYNLSAVTLGNLVGGFMVALVYWWAFAEKKA
ncbi:MAG: formate/nitrite transporter family protein [Mesosutterella multiformis]|jgi:formate transporter|nr:formate/nitrite transporter family protein [Mesosutterella multiformis]MBS5812900.1 formate/nitrite transporter family protein [Sutterella sp.]MCI1638602.1 formate/nitrite transporter family protein [Mesosutterella multiformis]